jgi:hypothetical protein
MENARISVGMRAGDFHPKFPIPQNLRLPPGKNRGRIDKKEEDELCVI